MSRGLQEAADVPRVVGVCSREERFYSDRPQTTNRDTTNLCDREMQRPAETRAEWKKMDYSGRVSSK